MIKVIQEAIHDYLNKTGNVPTEIYFRADSGFVSHICGLAVHQSQLVQPGKFMLSWQGGANAKSYHL